MGCCFSNDDDADGQSPEQGERRPLLDPVNPERPARPQSNYNTQSSTATSRKRADEQSALVKILARTADNVINVSAMDSRTMEQHEYMDRARQYSTRLALACSSSQRLRTMPALPAGVTAPQVVLASQPPPLADIQMITSAAEQIHRTVADIKVKHKEDLVVPFGVP